MNPKRELQTIVILIIILLTLFVITAKVYSFYVSPERKEAGSISIPTSVTVIDNAKN